ncbi:hypothetical protein LDENG_00177850 [Lucifuga dentata]|nr:hypothetical protein LDENG_00177850 [Lucifuga dentata]
MVDDTLCSEILVGSRKASSPSLLILCQALSSLTPKQVEQLWSNMCYVVQTLASLLLSRSSDCTFEDMEPSPDVAPSSDTHPLPLPPLQRRTRSTFNLKQLICNYSEWSRDNEIDAGLVTMCSDNDHKEFVKHVCYSDLLKKLLSNKLNNWLLGYCISSSTDPGYMVSLLCNYDHWFVQTVPVDYSIVDFCWNLDGDRFKTLLCEHTGLFTLVFSNPENQLPIPNCTHLPILPAPPDSYFNSLVKESCHYSEWHDVMLITFDVLSLCIRMDANGFVSEVCSNKTFLNELLRNKENAWLEEHCSSSLIIPPTMQNFNIPDWCDYHTWGQRHVDPSVVGLCWQNDQLAFQKNVCCNASLFEKLLLDLQNKWLETSCADKEIEVLPQVCKYSEWTHPIIVDMTELALCAELDPLNFTSNVCHNATVLQNLLANLDNTWLLQQCANYSNTGFIPSEQCQYSSWGISLPNGNLMAICWDYDQANFVASVCHDAALLSVLAREPSSMWVSTLCATYYTNGSSTNSSSAEPDFCLIRKLVKQFNLTCSIDFSSVCQPGANQDLALQMFLHCWVEGLRTRVEVLLTPPMANVLEHAVSTTVVILLALEEIMNTSLHVTENIRLSVLLSVVHYLEKEPNFDNKRVVLQCFGEVLTTLMQTGRDVTGGELFLIKEYFQIPLDSLRPVFSATHKTTVRLILQYYSRNKHILQVSPEYLSTLVSALFQNQLVKDENLFPDLAPLLSSANPADILALPPLQNNINVRETINNNLLYMSLEQRQAFGQWYSQVMGPVDMAKGGPSLIRDTGNLIIYLPFHNFQHLSSAQLLEGLDVLKRNTLTSLQQEFVAHSLIGTYRNLKAQDFTRLGKITCLADPKHLLAYKDTDAFQVIQKIIVNCTRQGESMPSHMISSLFLNSAELKSPSSLSPDRLAELAHLLPWLGMNFLQDLSQSQLLPALPALANVSFSPAQLSTLGGLQHFGSLILGLRTEVFWSLPVDSLLSSLPNIALHTPGLTPPQANAVATKLWGFPEVVGWLNNVEPLLSSTPLLSLLSRTRQLVVNGISTFTKPWNTQQSFKIPMVILHRISGTHQRSFPKKCVINELYQFEFFSELLGELGAEIALALPVSTIKKFPADMMDSLRKMILQDPHQFLLLPRTKQELLVDKMAQRMGMYTGVFTEDEFRSLGIMATFVVDEVFIQLDRTFFINNLDFFQGLCYNKRKRELVAQILQEEAIFGPAKNWTQAILSQVDRFLFFLPTETLEEISQELMTVGRIEKLFLSQRHWEHGNVGIHCMNGRDEEEKKSLFEQQQFVLQFFLGFLKMDPSFPIPTCEILHTTSPSVWTISSLTEMSSSAFSDCLELIGKDPFLGTYQRTVLLNKAKEVYGPVSSFSQSVISQLGVLATQLSTEELDNLPLMELSSIAAMGAITDWSSKQLTTLYSNVIVFTDRTASQLDSSTLVAMGNIVCGAQPTEMNVFNAVEFSKAALWLGQLKLPCTEEQLLALVRLLSHSLAFGQISSWGSEVFIEIGSLAAGLPDMAMSALVKEQIEGIAPLAISMIPPDKFAVVFNQRQISIFSYEQAVGVTADQRTALSEVQKTALAMVLTPWENRPVDFRGRSRGLALSPSPLCVLPGLLMLLNILSCPAVS